MADIGYSDFDERLPHPGKPEPQEQTIATERKWGAFGHFLIFLGQRLLYSAVILFFVIFLTYFGLEMAGGSSFGEAIQEAGVETFSYIGRLLQGDLGMSTAASSDVRPRPMGEVIVERMGRSLGLLAISLSLATFLGLLLGMRAARSGSKRSLGIILATIIGVSVPSFFAAFLLQWAVTKYTQWSGTTVLPVGGYGWDKHLILPVIVLAARPFAQITRVTFAAIKDVLSQDYVRTAQAKGLHAYQVTWSHVLRNAAIPILTVIGISFRFALSSLAVVELYFGWSGAGFTLLRSIAMRDDNLTVTFILLLGMLIVLVNIILEISYRFIDPRLWDPPSHIIDKGKSSFSESLRTIGVDIADALKDNRLTRWAKRLQNEQGDQVSEATLPAAEENNFDGPFVGKRSVWVAVRRNRPFTIGALLILGLLAIVVFGPFLSPHNPYTTQGLVTVEGQLTRPPLAPGETYPWGTDALGRDMQSLILSGAQQTIMLVVVVVVARFVLGVLLGAIAGWNNGGKSDRIILGLAEIIAAFPHLLLAMILILAVGIRQGMSTFLIAIGFIGWGEIMQFVRSKVTALRGEQFVESAVASGAGTARILNSHIMPNLFGSLVSLIALEMGAVLMLLGELGFLSIFLGGGSMIELPGVPPQLFSDVPEWGALLSNIRYQARAYPWTAAYTMAAFFLAIFAFNLFGEGVRRAVESGHLVIGRFVNRYSVVAVLAGILFFNWFQDNSGAAPFYREQAQIFDEQEAMAHVQALTDPLYGGRALGHEGQNLAAQYIAEQMDAIGLQNGGQDGTLFQNRTHTFGQVLSEPQLMIDDGGEALVFGQDFAVYPGQNISSGNADSQVRVVGLGDPVQRSRRGFGTSFIALDREDFSGETLLVLDDEDGAILGGVEKDGLLVVTDDPNKLKQRFTMSNRSGTRMNIFTLDSEGEETPSLWISEETADRLLASSGHTVQSLRRQFDNLEPEGLWHEALAVDVQLEVEGVPVEDWPVQHVIGYIPGEFGFEGCTDCLDREMVIVMAQYDSPPIGPDGLVWQAANDNASGVAVMLEAARAIKNADYQPRRSYLFIAYSGEGLDGGEPVSDPEVMRFMQAKTGFANRFSPVAIVHVRGVGDGTGERVEVSSSGSLRLADVFETAVRQTGGDPLRSEEEIDISLIYDNVNPSQDSGGQEAPIVRLQWEGWQENARLVTDTAEKISDEKLGQVGRALSMALMALGREINY